MVERRRNFNGIQLVSLMVSDIRPYTIKIVGDNVQAEEDFEDRGISFDLMLHMETMMNFTAVITYQEDRKFGTLLPDGE